MKLPTHRAPTHPGEMLLAEFLEPMGISQRTLADAIHVPYQRVNEIINQKRGTLHAVRSQRDCDDSTSGIVVNFPVRPELVEG